jgi:hypothetical protein
VIVVRKRRVIVVRKRRVIIVRKRRVIIVRKISMRFLLNYQIIKKQDI